MAITDISIVENNIIDNVNLLSINNPLVFVVRATFSGGVPPDYIYASLDENPDIDYKCAYLRDESITERDFYFIADEVLRSSLGIVEDFDQSSDTILDTVKLNKEITITFSDDGVEGEPFTDTITVMYANVSRDFEDVNGACLIDLYNNESKYYLAAKGKQVYLYWYNNDAANIIDGSAGLSIGANTDATVTNTQNFIVTSSDYNTWIKGGSGLGDIWCYPLVSPPDSRLVFEAQNGSNVTFSNISLPSGFSHTISGNGTSSARLIITVNALPLSGNWFRVRFSSDNTPMPAAGYVDINESYGVSGGQTFNEGFIRKAITPTSTGIITEAIKINDDTFTHTINVRDFCDNDILLKYLDRNGQFRIMPFTRYYSRTINPESIGNVNELILSLANNKGDTRKIGYKNKDQLRLNAEQLNTTELALMKDLYTSPNVSILLDKWVRVYITADNVVKQSKGNFRDISITAQLPQSYNITEL